MEMDSLPGEIAENILSLLPWQQRIVAGKTIPKWLACLKSPHTWRWVCTEYDQVLDRQSLRTSHQAMCQCIVEYGHYFQNCRLILHYLDFNDMELDLLELIACHCSNLKALHVCHPCVMTFTHEETLEKYVQIMNEITKSCSLKHLALLNMDYLAMNKANGILELFDFFVKGTVSKKVKVLEFSHAYDFSRPLPCMAGFENIVKLKCPVQVLTTGILLDFGIHSKLKELHLVNDGSTLNEDFIENFEIRWSKVAEVLSGLHVHYIFQERTLRPVDLCENPLVHSVVLDSLCNSIGADLLEALCDRYGSTLTSFALLETKWNFFSFFDSFLVPVVFAECIEACPKLDQFVCSAPIRSACVLLLSCKRQLCKFLVDADQVLYDMEDVSHSLWSNAFRVWLCGASVDRNHLEKQVSEMMGYEWCLLDSDQFSAQTLHLTSF